MERTLQRIAVNRRGVVGVAALWASATFWLALRIPTEPVAPVLWPVLFGSACIFTLAVLARPQSRRLHWWLTTVGLTAVGFRPSVTVARWLFIHTASVADVGFSITIYALAGFLWLRFSNGSLRAWRFNAIARRAGR
jgi:hypothetical protein